MISDFNLWSSLPVPTLLLNSDDKIVLTNPAAESFLNLSTRALVNQPVWDKVMVDAPLEAAFERAKNTQSSLFINDVDVGGGSSNPTLSNVQFAPFAGHAGIMIMMISPREIASRMNQTGNSHKAAKSAIGMAEMLAHEIKNPLAGITGAAQLLSLDLPPADLELTDLIVSESRRIVKLLENVEQFGNLTAPQLKPTNIHDVIDRARQTASVSFGSHMHFVVDYDPSLPDALADADQLQQVFLNLIKNACEVGSEGGTIKLKTFYDPSLRIQNRDGSHARLPLQIEIVDDGPGIPPAIADELFEPFVSGKENGTGLGLALVSKLLRDGGGWIAVDSVPGKTAFRVSLPRNEIKSSE